MNQEIPSSPWIIRPTISRAQLMAEGYTSEEVEDIRMAWHEDVLTRLLAQGFTSEVAFDRISVLTEEEYQEEERLWADLAAGSLRKEF